MEHQSCEQISSSCEQTLMVSSVELNWSRHWRSALYIAPAGSSGYWYSSKGSGQSSKHFPWPWLWDDERQRGTFLASSRILRKIKLTRGKMWYHVDCSSTMRLELCLLQNSASWCEVLDHSDDRIRSLQYHDTFQSCNEIKTKFEIEFLSWWESSHDVIMYLNISITNFVFISYLDHVDQQIC